MWAKEQADSTGVNVISTSADGDERTSSSQSKSNDEEQRHAQKVELKRVARKAKAKASRDWRAKLPPRLHACTEAGCNRLYQSRKWLEKHVAAGNHTAGSTAKSMLRKAKVATGRSGTLEEVVARRAISSGKLMASSAPDLGSSGTGTQL